MKRFNYFNFFSRLNGNLFELDSQMSNKSLKPSQTLNKYPTLKIFKLNWLKWIISLSFDEYISYLVFRFNYEISNCPTSIIFVLFALCNWWVLLALERLFDFLLLQRIYDISGGAHSPVTSSAEDNKYYQQPKRFKKQ